MKASEADLWEASSLLSEKVLGFLSEKNISKEPCFSFSSKTFSFHSNLRADIIKETHPGPSCLASSSHFWYRKPYSDREKHIKQYF